MECVCHGVSAETLLRQSSLIVGYQMKHDNGMPMMTSNCGKLQQGKYRRTLIMSIHDG